MMLLLAAAVFSLSTLSAQRLTILHTNDTHSHIDPVRSGAEAGLGGVIERAAYIDSVRSAVGKGKMLLVDAGDFSQGTSYFTMMHGDLEVDLINAMKYDVVCLGNHEFDNGLEELARRLGNLNCPAVCANYEFNGSELGDIVRPYAIIRRGGLKIGFIGLLTDVTRVVERHIADRITYLDPIEVTNRYAGYLKKQEAAIAEQRRLEERILPPDINYNTVSALRIEARQKLSAMRPVSVGQASRISGVSPADINVLIIYLEKLRRQKGGS